MPNIFRLLLLAIHDSMSKMDQYWRWMHLLLTFIIQNVYKVKIWLHVYCKKCNGHVLKHFSIPKEAHLKHCGNPHIAARGLLHSVKEKSWEAVQEKETMYRILHYQLSAGAWHFRDCTHLQLSQAPPSPVVLLQYQMAAHCFYLLVAELDLPWEASLL